MNNNQVQVNAEKFYSIIGPLDACIFSDIKVESGTDLVITTFKLRHSNKEIGRRVNDVYFLDSEVA